METKLLPLPSDRGLRVTPWLHASSHIIFFLAWLPKIKTLWGPPASALPPLKAPVGPARSFWKWGLRMSCWIYYQSIDSLLTSRANASCCLSSVGTSGKEEEGHPALLSGCFLPEGTTLTLVFLSSRLWVSPHDVGCQPGMPLPSYYLLSCSCQVHDGLGDVGNPSQSPKAQSSAEPA